MYLKKQGWSKVNFFEEFFLGGRIRIGVISTRICNPRYTQIPRKKYEFIVVKLYKLYKIYHKLQEKAKIKISNYI